jgi:hypothetical protein
LGLQMESRSQQPSARSSSNTAAADANAARAHILVASLLRILCRWWWRRVGSELRACVQGWACVVLLLNQT